jgi:diguanylate cyclase (GGDEF)-like protein
MPGTDREQLEAVIAAANQRDQQFDLELRITSAIGRRRWVRVQGRPLRRHGKTYGVSGTLQDITERRMHEEQLKRQAQTDTLTGLANRDSIVLQIERAIAEAPPNGGPALLYIDLDRFKIVNDMLGHAAGDRLLAMAAERLDHCAEGDTIAARFAGDDFLLLLPAGGDVVPQQLAERVTQAFAQPFAYAGEEFSLTASVGIARHPDDGATAQQLLNHADAAMCEAKRRGRNTWHAFSPQLARSVSDRLLIESQLRRALDNDEFRLEYQPTIDLTDGRIVAAEALLRWHSRQLGELPPGVFIGHAENSGDIVRIGAWVIVQACRQLREWRAAGLALDRIAVNVSYRQFLSENLVDTVTAALRETGLPGDSLELEMTERVLIDDVPDTLETFAALRALGVVLTIDDFGEGYSALNYLRRLPIDGLKISHGFMQGIPANATDSVICEAIIRIAASVGLTVTAEGVETEEQRRFLLERGAPLAQGFLFSRSLAPDRFLEFAETWSRRRE